MLVLSYQVGSQAQRQLLGTVAPMRRTDHKYKGDSKYMDAKLKDSTDPPNIIYFIFLFEICDSSNKLLLMPKIVPPESHIKETCLPPTKP